MGLCQSSEEDNQEHQRSNEIDKLIEKEKSNREKECKILLLGKHLSKICSGWPEICFLKTYIMTIGSGESGKSTILKQMKIINLNGFTQEELFTWRATVYRNVVESAQTIIQTISDLGLSYEKPDLNVKETYDFFFVIMYANF